MDDEKLYEILKTADDYVSGEHISTILNVSRTAVWKSINRLKSKGCHVLSVTNRGYKLLDDSDMLSRDELQKQCRTRMIGRKIEYFAKCTSTNDKAREGEIRGDEEGSVYITDLQTGGRGRIGRLWHFEANMGIAMSILLKPLIPPTQMMPISLIGGLAVCKAIEQETGLECGLKWPNDVISGGKKIAGILIETSTVGENISFIILGIGINCNNTAFPQAIAETASSILTQTGKHCSRKNIIRRVIENFEELYFKWIEEYDESVDFSEAKTSFSYITQYKERCINIGKSIIIQSVAHTQNEIRGIAKDVTPAGKLVVITNDGSEITVSSGEVSVRGENGYI